MVIQFNIIKKLNHVLLFKIKHKYHVLKNKVLILILVYKLKMRNVFGMNIIKYVMESMIMVVQQVQLV